MIVKQYTYYHFLRTKKVYIHAEVNTQQLQKSQISELNWTLCTQSEYIYIPACFLLYLCMTECFLSVMSCIRNYKVSLNEWNHENVEYMENI